MVEDSSRKLEEEMEYEDCWMRGSGMMVNM